MDPIGGLVGLVQTVFAWFANLVPGGFGLILLPLGVLGIVALIAAWRR